MKRFMIAGVLLLSLFDAYGTEPSTQIQLFDSVPARWVYQPQVSSSPQAEARWWETFGDPTLTKLISQAQENSLNLRLTLRRIEMARQSWQSAKAGWFPTVGASAGWTRERSSGDMSGFGKSATMSYFSLGLNFSWEADVFGRVAAQVKEGKTAYEASKAEYDAALVSLDANIATAYINLLLAQARIEVAEYQIESQQKIHEITVARHECGLNSKLDVSQSLSVLYSTQATMPALRSQEASAICTLATLVGVYPEKLEYLRDRKGKLPNPFVMTEIGVPMDLLRRRPDLIEAENEVAHYAAMLGVAKKDFLPTLSLTGSVGTSARRFDDLFTSESFTYSIAPQLTWTIFKGMARKYRVAEAKEQMLAGIDNYNLTLLNAVNETNDALENYRCALERINLVKKVCDESRQSLDLALDRYKKGLAPFTDVMNAQLTLLQYEDSYLETKGTALQAAIRIYQATAGSPLGADVNINTDSK